MPKEAYWFIFHKDSLLLSNENAPLSNAAVTEIKDRFLRQHLIAQFDNADIYCAELNDDVSIPAINPVPFKKALSMLEESWYRVAAKAYAILDWDKTHQYCGKCGEKTRHQAGTVERVCTACGQAFYPRISPSIIVLIQKGNEILMARSHHFPPGVFGLIAGFVEAGESLEEAIHREVMEEVGITIKNLRYFNSQSWPFPDSLMIGFLADYATGELTINPIEIEQAGWYTRDNMPGRPSSISIGNKLITYWLEQL